MHRSGTSALARAVNLLGASLGEALMAPQADDNPLGYWEHREVQRLQQDFLVAIDRSWDDPRSLPSETWARPEALDLVEGLAKELRSELGKSPFFALKDPRMCILGPIWARVQDRIGYEASAVAVLRHPRGVIDSLARRSEVPGMLSLWLWWQHNLGWMKMSRGLSRQLLVFEEMVADPDGAIDQIRSLDLPWWPEASARAAASIESTAPRSSGVGRPPDIDARWWSESLAFYEALRSGPRTGIQLVDEALERSFEDRMRTLDAELEPLGFLIRSESRHRWALARSQKSIAKLEARRQSSEDGRRTAVAKLQSIEGSGGYQALRRLQRIRQRLLGRG